MVKLVVIPHLLLKKWAAVHSMSVGIVAAAHATSFYASEKFGRRPHARVITHLVCDSMLQMSESCLLLSVTWEVLPLGEIVPPISVSTCMRQCFRPRNGGLHVIPYSPVGRACIAHRGTSLGSMQVLQWDEDLPGFHLAEGC